MDANDQNCPSNWPIAKRKRVEAALETEELLENVSHHDIVAFKRWRASEGAKFGDGIPNTVRKSGGNAKREEKREAIAAEMQKIKEDVQRTLGGIESDKSFRDLMLCLAVDEFRNELASQGGNGGGLRKIAQKVLDSGDFDGCQPVLCARGIVECHQKMESNPNFAPKCQGGKPTVLNSTSSDAFLNFAAEEWKSKNPSGQASVTSPEEELGKLWLKFYSNNDAVRAPEFCKKTVDRWKEAIKPFTSAQTGRKKNVRGAEAMDDPRNMIAFAAVCYATMFGVPDDLKLNYDDVSFMVAEDMGVVKICYAHVDVVKAMKELGRSMSWHAEADGPKTQVRMFVCGFLTTGAGRLRATVVKFYDRKLKQKDRIMCHFIGVAGNGCPMYWVNIKLPAQGEACNDDEEVNRIVMRDVVAKATQDNKDAFIAESRRIIQQASSPAPSNASAALQVNEMQQQSAAIEHEESGAVTTDHYRDDLSEDDFEEETAEESIDVEVSAAPANAVSNSATVAKLKELDQRRQEGLHLDRSVVVVDGACSQIQSLCGKPGTVNANGVIYEHMAPQGNDVIKGSAACSMAHNANDAGRCHSQLKSYVRTKFKWSTRHVQPNMQVFIETHIIPLGLDKGSLNTVLLFCGHLENMICKVFQPATIRSGWIKTGLVTDGNSSEGGLDLKRILSHWVGFKDLDQSSVQNIVRLVPTMALEVVTSTTVSDASMQQFEQYFPKEFIHYRKDRKDMCTSRGRSSVLLANHEMHEKRWSDAAPALALPDSAAQSQEQPPHYHGWKDDDRSDKAERICDCKANSISGARFYRNNPKAWADHQKTGAHMKYLAGPGAADAARDRQQIIGAVPFEPFSAHEYASNSEHACLAAIAAELSLSKAHAAQFAARNIADADAAWLAQMPPSSMQKLLGLPHALCVQMAARLRKCGNWEVNELDGFFAYFQGEGEDSIVAEIQSDGNAQQEGEGGGNAMENAPQ